MNYQGAYGGYSGLSGTSTFPSYDYKGGGLLDDDPRGLRCAPALGLEAQTIPRAIRLRQWDRMPSERTTLFRMQTRTVARVWSGWLIWATSPSCLAALDVALGSSLQLRVLVASAARSR